MEFEWDDAKAARNRHKHGVSFEEASSVFDDPNILVKYDEAHSMTEFRRAAIAISNRSRLLAVTYTRRGEAVRIASARKATHAEVQEYGQR